MFKTRKTLEIEYDPTAQQLAHLENTLELVENLVKVLNKEEEEIVYFNSEEFTYEKILEVEFFLRSMAEERYSSNILEQ